MKKSDLTSQEARWLLKQEGVTVRPSYHHEDYLLSSFSCPYPLKAKLDRMCKREGLTRSRIIQMFLENVDEHKFAKWIQK